jgi:hypothetical protein
MHFLTIVKLIQDFPAGDLDEKFGRREKNSSLFGYVSFFNIVYHTETDFERIMESLNAFKGKTKETILDIWDSFQPKRNSA